MSVTPAPTEPRATRAQYPASSKTLEANDRRIHDLAKAMLRLNAEGACTEALLLQEGFSTHELALHGTAAKRLADVGFVRQLATEASLEPFETDEQLLERAVGHVGGLIDVGQIVAGLRTLDFTHETIARLWPRLTQRLAKTLARSTMPVTN